ncbi:ABC transporter permease subunit [Kutzneria kofuensis]|uniref:ABC-type transport system involved in multi-copper enzyme maturation permease subunit n=1 Tax=Kutzneria kofuensis TaxID=103725 RepID=A0A7W9KME5_9PSEU|nr:ABC transporter permease subunit [Kutzneria kofuensis]MBB5895230.1 ABC-type transport system involved in multi-copper enzyme maturation permease subunit [Kutzneria kofuensis]
MTAVAEKPAVTRATLPDSVRVTLPRVLRAEWSKFWSLRSSYYALGGMVLAMVGLGGLFSFVTASQYPKMSHAQQLMLDPAQVSLRGYAIAQLVIGVLGVLVVTGEYGTGMIRSSIAAAPRRWPVLVGKAVVFAVITLVVTEIAAFGAFFVGQAFLDGQHIGTTIGADGVLRAVVGTGLYLTVVGLVGTGIGFVIRSTAGSVATVFGLLLVLPVLGEALPSDWGDKINPYLPSNAGQQVLVVHPDAGATLGPWAGFAVFCGYALAALLIGGYLLKRRDA